MASAAEIPPRLQHLREQLDRIVIGQARVKEQLLICLLAGGHGLVEGVPGTAKTLLVLSLSRLVGSRFKRVQFTPDLMPVDLLGTNVFNPKTQEFVFHPGPIFTDLLLADEVNRTPPKTQSALLEAMQEKCVTLDGTRHEVSPVFTVFATQNPVEFEGTYPLPEAQRDRFLLKIGIGFPAFEEEAQMMAAYASGRRLHDEALAELQPVVTREELAALRKALVQSVRVDPNIQTYILRLISATRTDEAVQYGAGPRASLALLESSRALALLRGRGFVIPDDIKELAAPVLLHRVTLTPEAEMEGFTLDDVLKRIFDKTEVPR